MSQKDEYYLHDYKKKLENQIKKLDKEDISKYNKEKIKQFLKEKTGKKLFFY